ncbi:unnamed protein product [Acanthoscelides obtectus]|uniref:Zinc finger PHD-type domain-containing protein n=1 Tax=Acanthoscelides obtectus TaxID=200917 RepID=A0A9P0PIZ6_ACAOB|nr:unnamed protein product [Acanthoscelides obtectus]CAK1677952.1 Tigger transposable element-derived protein 6 [Acanthoscelides obtectus]
MPRNYIRKTTRQNWDEQAMIKAIEAVKQGMPYKAASKQFLVPLMALKRRVKGKNVYAVGGTKMLGSIKKVFTDEQELELVQHIKDNEETMYGFTVDDVRKFAFEIAERNKIRHPFSTTSRKAGKDWLRGLRQRHPDITLRAPESTSAARARAFNKPIIDKFYKNLQKAQEKHVFPPHRIFNVDETSLNTVPTKNSKIFAKKGRKQVARITSAERGESTTAVICGSAGGNFIPPMLIFRRLRMKIELMDGTPPCSVYACNPSGWMNIEVFSQWFDHFLSHTKPSTEDPILLILDGHLSHTRNLDVIIKARENNVTILCLPPHCTHKLQPLDVGVMFPLSVYHNQALERWMNNNAGRVVTVFQIGKIFGEAYLKAAAPSNIIKGFEKCGIWALNPDVFTDVDFVAATTTDQAVSNEILVPYPSINIAPDEIQVFGDHKPRQLIPRAPVLPADSTTCVLVDEPSNLTAVSPCTLSTCAAHKQGENNEYRVAEAPTTILASNESISNSLRSSAAIPLPWTSVEVSSVYDNVSPSTSSITTNTPSLAAAAQSASYDTSDKDSFASPVASTSFSIPPCQIRPFPKMAEERRKNIKARVCTAILTSSPYKNYLEEEVNKKNEKERKKNKRNENKKNSIKGNSKSNEEKGIRKAKENVTEKYKRLKPKRGKSESSSEDESDAECLFCNERFSNNNRGEGWIKCCACLRWGHEACAGVDPDDADEFTCDFCVDADDRFTSARKQLRL